ncbi:MAG: hypothetical protein IJP77_06315 [Bacteroidales bacterium]|nr:hypothetical protein [Bacteroidales bacterium]
MAKIPFDIKFRPQIESGEYKVVDNDNHNIRIICWDKKTEKKYGYCIVGLVEFAPKHEESTYYTIDGKARLRDKHPCLFLVTPEPEMSEWELAIAKYRPPTDSKETIQRIASELLSLARKQLQPEINAEIEKAYKTADEVQYRKGREEALKDLPRWEPNQVSYSEEPVLCNGNTILNLGWVHIHIDQLKKLPGFKEDE